MNKQILLNLTSEWGDAVNYSDRHNARCRKEQRNKEKELHKMVNKALCFAIVGALAVVLNCTNLLAAWVATGVAIPCFCVACFIGGRIYENYR